MGAFFVATMRTGATLELSPAVRSAVIRRLQERSPGPVSQGGSDSVVHFTSGHDAGVYDHAGVLVLHDGHPMTSSWPASPALAEIAEQWASGAVPDFSSVAGSYALCAIRFASDEVLLVRDRFGTRPIFWHDRGDCLFAASEAALLIAAGVKATVDPSVMAESLHYRWLLGSSHLLSPFKQVPVAHTTLTAPHRDAVTRRYWRIPFAPEPVSPDALEHFVDQSQEALRETIRDIAATGRRIAVLLSGGVDSSIIAAIAQEVVPDCVAYVGRLPDSSNIELDRAVQVAAHLNMECRITDISPPGGEEDVRQVVRRLEELPRNPNNLVLEQLYRRIAGNADVVLQGDAAEVLFGLSDARRVAAFRRKTRVAHVLPRFSRPLFARLLRYSNLDAAQRLARVLDIEPMEYAATLDRIVYAPGVERALHRAHDPRHEAYLPWDHFSAYDDFDDALQAFQADTFLVSSLVRHDRLAQPHGLEAISPFLSGRMIDVACRLPRALRYTEFSKPVLRALCDRYFPAHVARWPKMGFEVPWHTWLAQIDLPGLEQRKGAELLPPGFLREAERARDMEAMWSALTLVLLAEATGG